MDIHKPRPWHNLREFLKEYAIIVLGVLTALVGEQTVESLHDRARAAETRASIREEIASDLGSMDSREASEACMGARLDEIDGLIAASSAGKLPPQALWFGVPIDYGLVDGKYKAATQTGGANLLDGKEQASYAGLYATFATYLQQTDAEMRAWADLRTLEKHPPPSPALDTLLRSAMQQARTARFLLGGARQVALREAALIGIKPSPGPRLKMPSVCVALHTPREVAVKMTTANGFSLHFP